MQVEQGEPKDAAELLENFDVEDAEGCSEAGGWFD
jgi:hypothetical protein